MAESMFQTDGRYLILNIDDFGMCNAINDAAVELLEMGNASSCTIMTPCPWSGDGMRRILLNGHLVAGVHLTVISEHPFYRWGALSNYKEVLSLYDESGRFFHSLEYIGNFVEKAVKNEVELEFRRQIEEVIAAGIIPDHLDSHCHSHERREDIFEMTLSLARDYDLPIRVRDASLRKRAVLDGHIVADHNTLDSYEIPTDNKSDRYIQLLKNLPTGVSEWAIHPSLETEELKHMEQEGWKCRVEDYRFFSSEVFRQVLEKEKIELITFKDLKNRTGNKETNHTLD